MERLRPIRWVVVLCGVVVITLVLGDSSRSPLRQTALAARANGAEGGCSLSSLRGAYVVSINGFSTSQTPPPSSVGAFNPVMVIGTFTFDGGGNVSRSLTVSSAGQPFPVADTGSYQTNPDCSGSASFPTNAETFGFNFVDSRSLAIVTTTPGEPGTGTLVKQEIRDCSTKSFRGVYITNGNGLGTFQNPPQPTDAFFPVSVVGSWTFDSKGGVSRSLSLNFGGFPAPYVDSGTYQVNSDCTASAYFPSDNEPFQLIFIDSKTIVSGVVSPGRVGTFTLLKQTFQD